MWCITKIIFFLIEIASIIFSEEFPRVPLVGLYINKKELKIKWNRRLLRRCKVSKKNIRVIHNLKQLCHKMKMNESWNGIAEPLTETKKEFDQLGMNSLVKCLIHISKFWSQNHKLIFWCKSEIQPKSDETRSHKILIRFNCNVLKTTTKIVPWHET